MKCLYTSVRPLYEIFELCEKFIEKIFVIFAKNQNILFLKIKKILKKLPMSFVLNTYKYMCTKFHDNRLSTFGETV